MANQLDITKLKQEIKDTIRRNSDRGFVPYGGCNRVCIVMEATLRSADEYQQNGDVQTAFDINIMVLLETVRLIAHADDSSGGCGDIIDHCLSKIDEICGNVAINANKHFFTTLIKTAKNKAFEGWAEWAYQLLKTAVYFVTDRNDAKQITDLFPVLGKMFDDMDYPDKYLINLGIIERLEGKDAARKYLFENLEQDELREIAVAEAIGDKDFDLAENLCKAALRKDARGYNGRVSQWLYHLETIYETTGEQSKLIDTVLTILLNGNCAYFAKLKALYIQQGIWEQERLPLWKALSKRSSAGYVSLLADEREFELLLEQIQKTPSYIIDYGKLLATEFPDEAYRIYQEYILEVAAQSKDKREYRRVCKYLKNFAKAGAPDETMALIEQLSEKYARRPAMLYELQAVKSEIECRG